MPNPRMPLFWWTFEVAHGGVSVQATTFSSASAKVHRIYPARNEYECTGKRPVEKKEPANV